jgi:hypothetical protein
LIEAMGIGMRMRSLWRLRGGVAVCVLLAVLAALWSLDKISLAPPRLTPRALEMATASTQVVVDTPTSAILDLRQDTYSFEGLRNRSVLLGNLIASQPLREEIARRANVPVEVLQVAAPRTPDQPRAVAGTSADRHTTDILRSNDQYRLNIQANPTVPVLDVNAQAPTAHSAALLANAAVDTLERRLDLLARSEQTPAKDRINLIQLGRASGVVINSGVKWQAAILAFLVTLGLSCATLIFLSRLREGWRLAALSERTLTD